MFSRFRGLPEEIQATNDVGDGGPGLRFKSIQKTSHEPSGRAAMDQRIPTLVVAQQPVQAVRLCVQDQDFVIFRVQQPKGAREAELERHIEAHWRAHAAQVVDRDSALANEIEDSPQATRTIFSNLQNAV